MQAFDRRNFRLVTTEWGAQPEEPRGPTETALLAMAWADIGDENALRYAELLRSFEPAEADAVVAHLYFRQGRLADATVALESLFKRLRVDPWPMHRLLRPSFNDATEIVLRDARFATRLYGSLAEPFVLDLFDGVRKEVAFTIAMRTRGPSCVAAATAFGPSVPWSADFLVARYECFRAWDPSSAQAAENDWLEFAAAGRTDFAIGLTP
jgi:hypothetical protein